MIYDEFNYKLETKRIIKATLVDTKTGNTVLQTVQEHEFDALGEQGVEEQVRKSYTPVLLKMREEE